MEKSEGKACGPSPKGQQERPRFIRRITAFRWCLSGEKACTYTIRTGINTWIFMPGLR